MRKLSKSELQNLSPDAQREYREKLVKVEWLRYLAFEDRRHLANICKSMPFFGNEKVGEEIARLLTLDHALSPITEKPKILRHQVNMAIKSLWKNWSGSIDENGKKIPDWIIMSKIGSEVGLEGDDDQATAEIIRNRLRTMGLK